MKSYSDWCGKDVYSDIQTQTILKQGLIEEVWIWYNDYQANQMRHLALPNKLAVERLKDELERLLKTWPKNK